MMKEKILKHKKIIILCLLCFISFNLITDYKQKEAQAVVGIDDAIIWTLGLLVLATGVCAVNDDQVNHMGSMVYNELSLDEQAYKEAIYGTAEEQAENDERLKQRFIKVTDKLKSIVNDVAENLTDLAQTITTDVSIPSDTMITPTFVSGLTFATGPNAIENIKQDYYNLPFFYEMTVVAKDSSKIASISFISDIEGDYPSTINVDTIPKTIRLLGYIDSNGWYSVRPYCYSNSYTSNRSIGYNSTVPFQFFYQCSDNLIISDMHKIVTIPYDNSVIKEGYDPTYVDENLKEKTYIPIPQTIPTDTVITTDIPLTWDKVIDTGLITDIPATQVGDFTQGLTGEITGTLDSTLDITFPNIFEMLKELLIYLFYPTVSVGELFSIPAGSGFANLGELFSWDSIFNIEPIPYEFKTSMKMDTLLEENEGARNWDIEIKLFDTEFMKNNIGIVRNVLSYSLLISVIYFVVYHFIPKRDMD